jgi:hypothetical protein
MSVQTGPIVGIIINLLAPNIEKAGSNAADQQKAPEIYGWAMVPGGKEGLFGSSLAGRRERRSERWVPWEVVHAGDQ